MLARRIALTIGVLALLAVSAVAQDEVFSAVGQDEDSPSFITDLPSPNRPGYAEELRRLLPIRQRAYDDQAATVEDTRKRIAAGTAPSHQLPFEERRLAEARNKLEEVKRAIVEFDAGKAADERHRIKALPTKRSLPSARPVASPLWGFDPTSDALPSGYAGESPKAYILAVAKSVPKKSEFETAAEYASKVRSLVRDSDVAVMMRPDAGATYDAEAGGYRVRIFGDDWMPELQESVLGGKTLYGGNRGLVLGRDRRVISQRTYVARNAFGVRARVSSTTEERYAFYVYRAAGNELFDYTSVVTLLVPVDRRLAPALKGRLRTLVVGRINASAPDDLFIQCDEYHEATIDSPFESSVRSYLLRFDPREIWIYDSLTGTVLVKDTVEGWAAAPHLGLELPIPFNESTDEPGNIY